MSDNPTPTRDVRAVWRGQPQEMEPMILETVRRNALRLQRRRLRQMIQETLAAAVVMVGFGLYIWFLPGMLIKIGSGLGVLFAGFYIWRWIRLVRPRRVPDDAAACLDFHRRELERQRDTARGMWRWALAPMIPISALFVIGRWIGPTPPWRALWLDRLIIAASSVLILESLALMWLWTRHRADKWQDQIDELDTLGKEEP